MGLGLGLGLGLVGCGLGLGLGLVGCGLGLGLGLVGCGLGLGLGLVGLWPRNIPAIKQRIDYKICLLTYKTLTNQQPTYLYNSLSFPSHSVSTRSSDSLVLSIPYARSSLGKRAFSVIGPRLWNSLPPDTRNLSSLPMS